MLDERLWKCHRPFIARNNRAGDVGQLQQGVGGSAGLAVLLLKAGGEVGDDRLGLLFQVFEGGVIEDVPIDAIAEPRATGLAAKWPLFFLKT